jgi:hypothetical protein
MERIKSLEENDEDDDDEEGLKDIKPTIKRIKNNTISKQK